MKKIIALPVIMAICFLCSCKKQSGATINFDFVVITNRNATVYEINKANGDVLLISGAEYTRLKEKSPTDQTNLPVTEWTGNIAAQDGTNTTSLKISLKHKWQNGQMYYIFTTDHYNDFFSQRMALGARAGLKLIFFDSDGFQKRTLQITLSQANLANYNGNLVLMENSFIPCSKDDYQDFKMWSLTWQGLYDPVTTASLAPTLSTEEWANAITALEIRGINPIGEQASDASWIRAQLEREFGASQVPSVLAGKLSSGELLRPSGN